MFDIGFFELLVIGVVLLLVMGPERLPEVAKQAAFLVRKARQSMFRLRNEMQGEIDGTPFADLEAAKREIADLKNDIRQFGRDLADSAEQGVNGVENPQYDDHEVIGHEASDHDAEKELHSAHAYEAAIETHANQDPHDQSNSGQASEVSDISVGAEKY